MQRIILLRHGKVSLTQDIKLTASKFNSWVVEYNNADLKVEILKDDTRDILDGANTIFSSALKRSIQSIKLYNKAPHEIDDLFNEAQLPTAKGTLIKLKPSLWLIIYRLLWLFGNSKNCELFKKLS